MAKRKEEAQVRVFEDPNFRRYKDTNYYLSRMGTIKRRCTYKDLDVKGYMENSKYCFYCKGKAVIFARAMYEAFRGSVGADYRVTHINGIKTDNRLENLRKLPLSEASRIAHKGRGLKEVYNIDTKETYRSVQECAKALGYTDGVIYKICEGHYKNNTDLKLVYAEEFNDEEN